MATNKKNNDRHFYLYAKGHYKKTEIFEDLKTIQANYVGMLKEHIDISHVLERLLSLAWNHIRRS